MLHVLQHPIGVVDDLPRPLPLDVGDEADPAGIVFEGRVVEPPGGRQAKVCGRGSVFVAHGSLSFVKSEGVVVTVGGEGAAECSAKGGSGGGSCRGQFGRSIAGVVAEQIDKPLGRRAQRLAAGMDDAERPH